MCLENEIKTLIIESLELEDITIDDIKDEEPLFVSGLGLDSIDALELGMALKKKYPKTNFKKRNLFIVLLKILFHQTKLTLQKIFITQKEMGKNLNLMVLQFYLIA